MKRARAAILPVVFLLSLQPAFGQVATAQGAPVSISNLTTGRFIKSGLTSSVTTAPVSIAPNSIGLLHLMSCCNHATVPTVRGAGLSWELLVTHTTGQKRHWVFRAATTSVAATGSLTVAFAAPQSTVLWIADAASGVVITNNGADAIVQVAWQDSQTNATTGAIALGPFASPANAAIGFGLAGSGSATDIVPEAGYTETAQVASSGSNLIIDTFWGVGEDRSVSATFVDGNGAPQMQSWLFLAAELRAAGTMSRPRKG